MGNRVKWLVGLLLRRCWFLWRCAKSSEKHLEDHEVAVLELERQVSVVELGENFERLSVLVNDLKITFGQDLAPQRSLILNEVYGDHGDWLGHYDQFNDLLVWQQEFIHRVIPAQEDMLQRLLQLQSWAETVSVDGLQ